MHKSMAERLPVAGILLEAGPGPQMADAINVNLLEYSLEIGVVTDIYGVCRGKGCAAVSNLLICKDD
jgi:hypothetical protein